jgi:AraC family transcriptional regulator
MLKEKPLTIDFAQEDAILQILPHAPLRSSSEVDWNGIRLEHHLQPAHVAPVHCPAQHVVVIHHKFLPRVERQLDSQYKCDRIASGDIVIAPVNVSHKACWGEEAEFTLLIVEPTLVAHTAYESIDPDQVEILPHFATPDLLICQIGRLLKSELESNGLVSQLYAESAASFLAVHLLRYYSTRKHTIQEYTGGLPNSQLQQVIDYVNANLAQDISLTELAKLVQMSSYHFGRLFKQSIGVSPYRYLIERRIERAKSLLTNTDLTVAEIAERTGFNSHSYLTRIFRQHLSTTPKAFRQMQ